MEKKTRQQLGFEKMYLNGQRFPMWMMLIHTLDGLQGQHKVHRGKILAGIEIDPQYGDCLVSNFKFSDVI